MKTTNQDGVNTRIQGTKTVSTPGYNSTPGYKATSSYEPTPRYTANPGCVMLSSEGAPHGYLSCTLMLLVVHHKITCETEYTSLSVRNMSLSWVTLTPFCSSHDFLSAEPSYYANRRLKCSQPRDITQLRTTAIPTTTAATENKKLKGSSSIAATLTSSQGFRIKPT